MTITTKYEIGQSVWVMRGENEDARPKEVQIDYIQTQHGESSSMEEDEEQGIFYDFYNDDIFNSDCAEEKDVFATKQELLDSL